MPMSSRRWTGRDWLWLLVAGVGYAAAVAFLVLWRNETNQDWAMGTVPDWIAVLIGACGLGAIAVAVQQLREHQRDSASREERERRAQASRVYWRVEMQTAKRAAGVMESGECFTVVNGSDEPIRNVGYVAVRSDGEQELVHLLDRPLAPAEEAYAALFDYTDLPAGFRGVRSSIPHHYVETESTTIWDVAIAFSDSADRKWIRLPNLVVEEVDAVTTDDLLARVKEWRASRPSLSSLGQPGGSPDIKGHDAT